MASRTLLVASGGGHLKQLTKLAERFPWAPGERTWCTVDTPQSRSLLDGEEVVFIDSADPRDLRAALANARRLRTVIRSSDFTHAVSTGASPAVSGLPQAQRGGASCHYIESAARVVGPSLSGRLLGLFPRIHRYTQYRRWARRGWVYAGSVFDAFEPGTVARDARLNRVVVALGTQADYGFRSLVERLVDILPPTADVLWQTGATDVSGLDIDARPSLPSSEFEQALAEADLVVAHAGVGSALSALEAGRQPILVPRRAARGEHVDDHQEQVAEELSDRGLAIRSELDELDVDVLCTAATRSVSAAGSVPVLRLDL